MTRRIAVVTLSALALGVVMSAAVPAQDLVVPIQISPKVLYPPSAGPWVTIHVDVPYAAVVDYAVEINGQLVDVARDKADLQGNLVIKLRRAAVVEVVDPGWVPVIVSGVLAGDMTFMGAKDYLVREQTDQGQSQTKKQSKKQNRNRNRNRTQKNG